MIICCLMKTNTQTTTALSSGKHLLIIWWSSVNYLNYLTKNKAYHLVIICCLITNKQTNKQTNMLIIWWSYIIWRKKQPNKACHLMIISWFDVDYLTMYKQTNRQLMIICNCWLSHVRKKERNVFNYLKIIFLNNLTIWWW